MSQIDTLSSYLKKLEKLEQNKTQSKQNVGNNKDKSRNQLIGNRKTIEKNQ